MAMLKLVPYTPEQSTDIVGRYQAGESVDSIALAVDRSVRSVVAKLSREGVYIPKTKKEGSSRMTKAEIVQIIADRFGIDVADIATVEKASHEHLIILLRGINRNE
ncbi:hypothetical protein UFOVP961_71 [uncultured Caudovirales phage]|uniref:Uncharacterized protein n=1 Tax=uncultured Caudovirales phage TaxID=2100421 RepID=A0A6J5SLG8_9CAUD|nr:hypothetical protein UFOVP961_71 [uncultured Caudovirales phage]CAB4185774.1 hypothetical protein UFOVP1123_141 [uncultured Caudovirales phage]CAB4193026.1 hypothetical protein UFOVP1239_10 [uncultured Caudovirales phage]CAB4215759.1 hypothetical protein UFOVP1484_3 [uncultured Caudovirales phage]CAB5230501.1 hypothetical protein UFOVP1577_9 [uncultured Caudovirales phage]